MKSTTSKQFSRPKFTWNGRETGSDHDPPEVRIEKLGRTMLRMSDLKKLSVQFKVLNSRKLTLLVNTRCILCRQRNTRQKATPLQRLRMPPVREYGFWKSGDVMIRLFGRQNALRISRKFNIRSAFYFRSSKPSRHWFKSKKGETDKKKAAKKITSFDSWYIFLVSNFCTIAPHGYLVAPTLKIMFEVYRSLALDKTNERRICFYWHSCFLLVWHKLIW